MYGRQGHSWSEAALLSDDLRLIEDRLPIEAIGTGASREKSVRKGHISKPRLWRTWPPPVLSRAAVYGALVPARPARPLTAGCRTWFNPDTT